MKLTGRLIITDACDLSVNCNSFAALRRLVLGAMWRARRDDLDDYYLRVKLGRNWNDPVHCLSGVELLRKLEEWEQSEAGAFRFDARARLREGVSHEPA